MRRSLFLLAFALWGAGCSCVANWGSQTDNRPCGAHSECLPGYTCVANVCVALGADRVVPATDGSVQPGQDASLVDEDGAVTEPPDAEAEAPDAATLDEDGGIALDDAGPPDATVVSVPDSGTCSPFICAGVCIGGDCRAPTCIDVDTSTLLGQGTVCRKAAGDCDVAETCNGVDPTCPADVLLGPSTTCRAAVGGCDLPEVCDGVNPGCPADLKVPANTVCHASAGLCDPAEKCDGVSGLCPPNVVASAGTVCRPAAGGCDAVEKCDGTSPACPPDLYLNAGTECRATAGLCDVAEVCPGGSPACPADAFQPATTICRQPGPVCGLAQNCPGNGAACPPVQTSGAPPVPANPVATMSASMPITAALTWGAVTDPNSDPVGYSVELSKASSFSPLVASSGSITAATWQTPTLDPFTTYYWHVKATDTAHAPCDLGWTATASFTTPPPAPTTVHQGDVILSCGTPMPWGATLTWAAVSGPHPVTYNFQFTGSGDHAAGWVAPMYNGAWQAGTSFAISLASYDTYYWRVRTRDETTSAISPWSAEEAFYLTDDCTSCPLIFTWDGSQYQYLTDIAGWNISFSSAVNPNIVMQYQPQYFVLGGLTPTAPGEYGLRIREVLTETAYMDEARLAYVDAPDGYEIASSSAEHVLDAFPLDKPFKLYTLLAPISPIFAVNQEGLDVLASLLAVDNVPALARNNVYESYTLDFGPVADLSNAKLVIDGWKANNIKASVASSVRPFVEVLDATGQWVKVTEFGPPKGDLKMMVVDLSGLFLTAEAKVRVNLGLYPRPRWAIDRIRLDTSVPIPVGLVEVPAFWADLHHRGNDTHSDTDLTTRIYAFDDVLPDQTSSYSFGAFTRYGDVTALVDAVDDLFAIMRHGDEVELHFRAPAPPAPGMTRTFLLKTGTYYKGMKYRAEERFVDPLPYAAMPSYPYAAPDAYPSDQAHLDYLNDYNTRVELP